MNQKVPAQEIAAAIWTSCILRIMRSFEAAYRDLDA
jgi:hypothetical protein